MTPELKQRWLEALKSGKYAKGKHLLKATRRDGTECFCCLGVLGVVAKEELEQAGISVKLHGPDGYMRIDGEESTLLKQARKTLGLYDHSVISLINMNDRTSGFNSVIEYIEERV